MKVLVLSLLVLLYLTATAQSPGLTINVIMDSMKADGIHYKIEMNICKPKKMTARGSWFSHDTSKIDFASLKASDIECGGYFENGMPTLISGQEEELFNRFEFSNQVFAWEEIYFFRITNRSSRGWWPPMYIVIPIKYKSFRTHIDITDIEFQSDKVVVLTDVNAFYDDKELNIQKSLKNVKGVEVDGFPLEEILKKKS